MEPLRRRSDFEHVFEAGKFLSGRVLAVRFVQRGEGPARVGYAVGKRLDARAVVRNRARRRLKEAIRPLTILDGYDVVVLARRSVLTEDFGAIQRDVRAVFGRAGVLGGKGGA